jgi:hypothetical protein
MFTPYPDGGGSWEEDEEGEVWFAAPDQVTHWCEMIEPASFSDLAEPSRIIENVTELFVYANSGGVNTCKRGEANTTLTRTTRDVVLAVGQRMIIERKDGVLRIEVLPPPER